MMKHFWQFLFGIYVLMDGIKYFARGDASWNWQPHTLIICGSVIILLGMIKVFHEAK